MSESPRIVVEPPTPTVDTELRITLTGFAADESVTVHASTRDGSGRPLHAQARFHTDADGEVDVATQAPVDGTYSGPEPMGLIWSASPADGEVRRPSGALPPARLTLTAEVRGDVVATTTLDRLRLPEGVRRSVVREQGLVGTLFHHEDGVRRPGVLLLGGSEGGLHELDAALLAGHGFTVFALAYFGVKDVPDTLVDIPLEYFGAALAALRDHGSVQPDRIAVMGGSRGGEAALLIGSEFPEVGAVVSVVGSGVLTQGIGRGANLLGILGNASAAWTRDGKPLPYLANDVTDELVAQVERGGPVWLELAFPVPAEDELGPLAIPVEQIRGGVLLVSAGQDRMWPCAIYSEVALRRLERANHPYPYRHLHYADAGHLIAAPPYGPATEIVTPGPGVAFDSGGTAAANASARADAWTQTVAFLTDVLT